MIGEKKIFVVLFFVMSLLLYFFSAEMQASQNPGKRALPGDNVSPSVWNPEDGHYYKLRSATGSRGIPLIAIIADGVDSHSNYNFAATSSQIATSNGARKETIIQLFRAPYSSAPAYIGSTSTVTTPAGANPGIELIQGDSLVTSSADDIWAYCSATCAIHVWEVQ